ncbi:uncharacterized protein [Miscanthus floridulus]|uniref:uncharacterized protein n=1 Tax=Miscanthus floridulus TaxID=154761 RepID=UPI003459BEB9
MTKLSRPTAAAADHRDLPAQVQHSFHQGHGLKLVPNDDGVKFKCDGCKLPGTGARYECERGAAACNLDLHISCALAPALREIGGHWFVLLHEPLPGEDQTFCDACGGDATGFVYHCPDLEHDVHPCCAGLPETFDLAGLSFELRMKDDVPQRRCALCTEKTKCKWGCRRCGVNRKCWSYRSFGRGDDDDVFLHVACARDAFDDCFTKANVSLGKAMAARASETGSVVVDASRVVYHRDQDMVPVEASVLRALLKGQGRGHRGRGGGALERSLRVLGFIVRVVIGVIFGDPTAMIVAVGQLLISGG